MRGWAVKYKSGLDDPEINAGFWLAEWVITGGEAIFRFEAEMHMCFHEEGEAIDVSNLLRANAEIQTEVVKVG